MKQTVNPKVSVVLPVYNVEPWIERCIESLQAQTIEELEFIFVDDCGTDGSMAAVEAWATEDPRVRIIRNAKNLGAGPSRNAGIEAARGDYLSFIDPDDYVSPDFYQLLYAAAISGDGYDVAKGQVCRVDSKSGEIDPPINVHNDRIRKGLAVHRPLCYLLACEHWTCLWKYALFENADVRYGESIASEDTVFQLRASYYADDIIMVDGALYYYVQRPDSASHRDLSIRTIGEFDALCEKAAFLHKVGFDEHATAFLKSQVKMYVRRFQVALGDGLASRDLIPFVVERLSEVLRQAPDVDGLADGVPQLEEIAQGNDFTTPGLRSPGEGEVRVSVVLSVHDVEPCISRCIESLRQQLLDGLEFIFVDDCGTDGSMAAVEEWAAQDDRVRILRNEKTIGPGPSYNRGMEVACGDYLSFVDPEDYVDPFFYQLLYAAAASDGGHDISKGIGKTMLPDGTARFAQCRKLNERMRAALQRGGEPLRDAFTSDCHSAIYRRTLIEKGARFGVGDPGYDATFLFSAALHTEDVVFEEAAAYRHDAESEPPYGEPAPKSRQGDADSFELLVSQAMRWVGFMADYPSSSALHADGCAEAMAAAVREAFVREGNKGAANVQEQLEKPLASLPALRRAKLWAKTYRRLWAACGMRAVAECVKEKVSR